MAGVVTAVLVAVFSQNRRLKEDSVIGIFFAGAFALGIVIISRAPGYSGSVQDFLFGTIVGVSGHDVLVSALAAAGLLVVLALFYPQIVAVGLDRETARALGLPVLLLDVLLSVVVTVSVVVSLQTIGNVLVLALVVVPASAARLVCSRITTMLWWAPVFGAGCAVVGLYLSWSVDLPVGGTIVLVMVAGFLMVWTVQAVRRGVSTQRGGPAGRRRPAARRSWARGSSPVRASSQVRGDEGDASASYGSAPRA